MMGSVEDPKDGAAVAGTVFSAVVVYAVSLHFVFFRFGVGVGDGDRTRG